MDGHPAPERVAHEHDPRSASTPGSLEQRQEVRGVLRRSPSGSGGAGVAAESGQIGSDGAPGGPAGVGSDAAVERPGRSRAWVRRQPCRASTVGTPWPQPSPNSGPPANDFSTGTPYRPPRSRWRHSSVLGACPGPEAMAHLPGSLDFRGTPILACSAAEGRPRPEDAFDRALASLTGPQLRGGRLARPAALCIVAGAGSGKTRVLTLRVARRILDGSAEADHTAVCTFTRKAARELRGGSAATACPSRPRRRRAACPGQVSGPAPCTNSA